MADTLEPRPVHPQQFAPPCGTVRAEPIAVQRQTEDGRGACMLSQHRGNVGMVMLHRDGRDAKPVRHRERDLGGVEVGVEIVSDRLRAHRDDGLQVLDRLLQRVAGTRVVEIADVLRQEGLVAAGQAHRALQIRPQSEHWRHLAVEADRSWRVSPCSTQEMQARLGGGGRSGRRDHQRVVAAHHDVAIVDEIGVCDPGEATHRLCVVDEQRFATGIGGGHDQRQILFDIEPMRPGRPASIVMEEQIMNWRRGQHQTDPGQLGRNPP